MEKKDYSYVGLMLQIEGKEKAFSVVPFIKTGRQTIKDSTLLISHHEGAAILT